MTGIPQEISEELLDIRLSSPGLALSRVLTKNVGLYLLNFSGAPYTETENATLIRFGKAFEQSYTRFLDLQKAESQAREAQIEAALERVRSRSLAMHKSEELEQVILVVSEQLQQLQFKFDNVSFGFDTEQMGLNFWLASPQLSKPFLIKVPYIDNPAFNRPLQTRKNGVDFNTDILSREENLQFLQHMFDYSDLRHIPAESKSFLLGTPGFARSQSLMKNTILTVGNYVPAPYSQEQNVIIKRFGNVFEQAYVRFLDLQKAEAQAREAQIQLALERVRARTMAMQRSDELQDVANTIYERLNELKVEMDFANLATFIEGSKDYYVWVGGLSEPIRIPFNDFTQVQREYNAALERRDELFTHTFSGGIKDEYHRFLLEQTELGRSLPDEQKKHLLNAEFNTASLALTKNTCIQWVRLNDKAFSNEENDLLKRFVNVFEQAYTRFLDLQKAEAQVREAQIETSVERVRSQAMAMRSSEDLIRAAEVLRNEMVSLKVDGFTGASFYLVDEQDWISMWDFSDPGNLGNPASRLARWDPKIYPTLGEFWRIWKEGTPYFVIEYGPDKLKQALAEWYEVDKNIYAVLKQAIETGQLTIQWNATGSLSRGVLSLDLLKPPTEDTKQIVMKMTGAFDLAYQRFEDLKQAEAQAREAQIEAALERVRARTMGMQHSNELQATALLLFQQILSLGVSQLGCGFNIWDDDRKAFTSWMGGGLGEDTPVPSFKVPTSDDIFLPIREAAERGESLFISEQHGVELEEHYRYMFSLPIWKDLMAGWNPPTFQVMHCAYFSQGFLMFISKEPVPQAHDIFKRFAKVFEQTYTRFLDLQKAEAQAREAQIEAALERVRANAMAMQRSSDLLDIVVTMRHEFTKLGHAAHYFWYMNWLPDKYEKAMTSGDGTRIGMVLELPRGFHGNAAMIEWELNDEPIGIFTFETEAAIDYLNRMASFGQFRQIDPNAPGADAVRAIGGLTFVMARTRQGEIGYSLPGVVPLPPPEDMKTLVRFAGVFDLAYQRYSDIAKAESSVKAALQQSSLDRVRAEIASMRTKQDLERITPLIWKELTTLGIPFVRCGVFIMDEHEELIHTFLSTPDGKAIAAFHLPYTSNPFFNAIEE